MRLYRETGHDNPGRARLDKTIPVRRDRVCKVFGRISDIAERVLVAGQVALFLLSAIEPLEKEAGAMWIRNDEIRLQTLVRLPLVRILLPGLFANVMVSAD